MKWYEKIVYEFGHWLMNTPPTIGSKLCNSMLAKQWNRNNSAFHKHTICDKCESKV